MAVTSLGLRGVTMAKRKCTAGGQDPEMGQTVAGRDTWKLNLFAD